MTSLFLSTCIWEKSRTDLHFAKVVNGHKKKKPQYSPPAPKFQRDTSTYSAVCFFIVCLTDEVSVRGNMVRLQSDIWHLLLRVSLPSTFFLSFLTSALIEGARTGNGRCHEGWGRLAGAIHPLRVWDCRDSREHPQVRWRPRLLGDVDSQGYPGRSPRKQDSGISKKVRPRANPKLQGSWMFEEKRRNLGENEGLAMTQGIKCSEW